MRNFALNAAIALAGVMACAATVYPTFNDAAQTYGAGEASLASLAKAMVLPATSFGQLTGSGQWRKLLERFSVWQGPITLLPLALMSALLFGSTLGLVRRPAALLASWAALLGLSGFFAIAFPGQYRHQALWLVFVVSMYWIAGRDGMTPGTSRAAAAARNLGLALLMLLMALQTILGLRIAGQVALGHAPESRSRDLAQLIMRTPGLRNATIMADPDFLVEPLAYYLDNPTYLAREGRFGNVVRFTRQARLSIGLDELLGEARRLRETTGQPVVILLRHRLDASAPAQLVSEGYNWHLSMTPAQVQTFLASTRRLERFGPACCTDESFDVYILD